VLPFTRLAPTALTPRANQMQGSSSSVPSVSSVVKTPFEHTAARNPGTDA